MSNASLHAGTVPYICSTSDEPAEFIDRFNSRTLYLTDDHIPSLSADDIDELSGLACLLRPKFWVGRTTSSSASPAEEFKGFKNVRSREHASLQVPGDSISVATSVASCRSLMDEFVNLVTANSLRVCTFYPNLPDVVRLLRAVSDDSLPNIDAYALLSDRLLGPRKLVELGVNDILESRVVHKGEKLKTTLMYKPRDPNRSPFRPLAEAERALAQGDEVICQEYIGGRGKISPNLTWLCSGGDFLIFPPTRQIIAGFRHRGNRFEVNESFDIFPTLVEIALPMIEWTRKVDGYFGLDFVSTLDGRTAIVDVNPRINYGSHLGVQLLTSDRSVYGATLEKVERSSKSLEEGLDRYDDRFVVDDLAAVAGPATRSSLVHALGFRYSPLRSTV
jgi:ATP-grasp domain